MPKSTDDEIIIRRHAITEGYLNASHVPLETAKQGIMALTAISRIAATCNANAITDLLAAAYLAQNAVIIAGLNVRINLTSLDQEEPEISTQYTKIIDSHERTALRLVDEIGEMVGGRM
jgi:formiminotetrahydrofolate cyclodeaminase